MEAVQRDTPLLRLRASLAGRTQPRHARPRGPRGPSGASAPPRARGRGREATPRGGRSRGGPRDPRRGAGCAGRRRELRRLQVSRVLPRERLLFREFPFQRGNAPKTLVAEKRASSDNLSRTVPRPPSGPALPLRAASTPPATCSSRSRDDCDPQMSRPDRAPAPRPEPVSRGRGPARGEAGRGPSAGLPPLAAPSPLPLVLSGHAASLTPY